MINLKNTSRTVAIMLGISNFFLIYFPDLEYEWIYLTVNYLCLGYSINFLWKMKDIDKLSDDMEYEIKHSRYMQDVYQKLIETHYQNINDDDFSIYPGFNNLVVGIENIPPGHKLFGDRYIDNNGIVKKVNL